MLSAELRPQGSIHVVGGGKNGPIHSRLLTESLKPVHCLRIVWSTSSSREFLEIASRQKRSAFTLFPQWARDWALSEVCAIVNSHLKLKVFILINSIGGPWTCPATEGPKAKHFSCIDAEIFG